MINILVSLPRSAVFLCALCTVQPVGKLEPISRPPTNVHIHRQRWDRLQMCTDVYFQNVTDKATDRHCGLAGTLASLSGLVACDGSEALLEL